MKINKEDYKFLVKYFICLEENPNVFKLHEISKQQYLMINEKIDKIFNCHLIKHYFIILNGKKIQVSFDIYNVLKDTKINNRLHYIERRYGFLKSFDEIINCNHQAITNSMALQEKNPETIIIEIENYNILINKIKNVLSKKQFKIFAKRYILEKSCKEIATEEGVTTRDIQINISRILKKVRKKL